MRVQQFAIKFVSLSYVITNKFVSLSYVITNIFVSLSYVITNIAWNNDLRENGGQRKFTWCMYIVHDFEV